MFRLLAPLAFSVGLKAAKDSIAPSMPTHAATIQPAKPKTSATEVAETAVLFKK